jgi:ribonuclease T2
MVLRRIRRAAQAAALAFSFVIVVAVVAFAEDAAPQPRPFDFYVLALSWSPSYCASARERAPDRKPSLQCSGRPYAFVVHGLWPQFSQGFPSYCRQPAPRLNGALVGGMLDLMPSRPLIYYEWRRHGTCSGLNAQAYFDTMRKARAAVTIPSAYRAPAARLEVTPAQVAADFVKANPGLPPGAFAVVCNKTRLTEVRLCMGKDLAFRDCAAIARRSCKRSRIVMPAVRGKKTGESAGLDSANALSRH